MRTVVIGLGSPILGDDSVGLKVLRELSSSGLSDVELVEAHSGGLALLEEMAAADRVVLVDASLSCDLAEGEISVCGVGADTQHAVNCHDCTLEQALALGRALGLALPSDEMVTLVAIGVKDVTRFGETLSPAVAAAVPKACDAVRAILSESQPSFREAIHG